MPEINLYNMDCMEFMKDKPDNYYDLAVVDPPYGISEDGKKNHSRGVKAHSKIYTPKNWDKKTMDKKYFTQLKRVAKNYIIWGANHFIENIGLFNSSCWLVWDKLNGRTDFADCELALTNFKSAVRVFKFRWQGMLQGDMKNKEYRIHPTQKPIALYKWLLTNYAKKGDKIFDSHLGSGSIAIACYDLGFDLDATELDNEYYDDMMQRFELHKSNQTLFEGIQ